MVCSSYPQQQKVDQAAGSTNQQAKGVAKQVDRKIQKGVGDIQEALTDTSEDAQKGRYGF